MEIEITNTLKNYINDLRMYASSYRNRATNDSTDWTLPIMQPDLYVTDYYKKCPAHTAAIGLTYEVYKEYSDISLQNLLTDAGTISENIPYYLLINMYGHTDEWQDTIEHLQQLVPELKVKDVERMLIEYPNHKITLLQAGNSFVILTNVLRKSLFPKLNAAFYYLREQEGLLISEAEEFETYLAIRDTYVDEILTRTDGQCMHKFYTALEEERNALAVKKEQELQKQNTVKLLGFLQDNIKTDSAYILQNKIQEITATIKNHFAEIKHLNAKLKQTKLYFAGIKQMAPDEDTSNFIQALQEDLSKGSLVSVLLYDNNRAYLSSSHTDIMEDYARTKTPYIISKIILESKSIMKYWNEEYANILLENTASIVHEYGTEACKLFKAVFIDKTVQVRTTMRYAFQRNFEENYWVSVHRFVDDSLGTNNLNGCPHPHIMCYDCWGDNDALIAQALNRGDIYTAYLICKQVLESISLSDSAVVERLLQDWTVHRTDTSCKYFLIDDKTYNLREAYNLLCEKERATTETVENNEEVQEVCES